MARYYVDNEMGRQISAEQALGLLDIAEESALVISPNNAQEPEWICLCCKCCCGVLKGSGLLENPADYAHSSYQAEVDAKLCSACGVCLDRCQIDARKVGNDGAMEVDPARCLGCGLCVSTCPENAATLVEKTNVDVPPRIFDDTMAKIAKERGLG
jgi:ferredoxin